MEALSISCRNKHWSQYFNQILFSSISYLTICPAVVVQAALDSRAACDQCLFLQLMLSPSILKSVFELRTWITKVHVIFSHQTIIPLMCCDFPLNYRRKSGTRLFKQFFLWWDVGLGYIRYRHSTTMQCMKKSKTPMLQKENISNWIFNKQSMKWYNITGFQQ